MLERRLSSHAQARTGRLIFSAITLLLCACGGSVEFPNAPGDQTPDPEVPTPDTPTPDTPTPDAPTPDAPTPDTPTPGAPSLDRAVFAGPISAALSPCSLAPTCHLAPDGAFGQDFAFFPDTDVPAEIDANLAAVRGFVSFDEPAASPVLTRGRDNHSDLTLSDAQYCEIFDWIQAALPADDQACTPP